MAQYYFYQTDGECEFLGWSIAKNKFNMNDYKLVYCGEIIEEINYAGKREVLNQDNYEVLEDLFELFNDYGKRPDDFAARSMSVSDVVVIKRRGSSKTYYCDSIGWVEVQ